MKKKILFALTFGCCLSMLMAGAACAKPNELEKFQGQGYKVSVTYDANGGEFLNRPGVTIMDMYNPEDYRAEDGSVKIQLTEPTATSRPNPNTLTLSNHFFAGWYKTRTVKTVDGKPVDKDGRELEEREDGTYVYATLAEGEKEVSVTPAYEYSDYWDFQEDRLEYSAEDGETLNITLYAGWVEYYEFRYFYKMEGEDTWTQYTSSTAFDWKITNAAGSSTADKDTIWVPDWKDGAMNYDYTYANKKDTYSFPKISGTTFLKAYEDEACTKEITEKLEHKGTLDYETGKAIDRVQNVYFVVEEGEKYRISTAKQLADNPNLNGIYEIQADLDFSTLGEDQKPLATWPLTFANGQFKGKMYSAAGHNYSIKNADVTIASNSVKTGGLFGSIAKDAEISNLTFENVTVSLAVVSNSEVEFGLFSGDIDEGALLTNVKVGGLLRLGRSKFTGKYSLNLLANGNLTNLVSTGIGLEVYGEKVMLMGELKGYQYTIDPAKVVVDNETKNITLTFAPTSFFDDNNYQGETPLKEKYEIIKIEE